MKTTGGIVSAGDLIGDKSYSDSSHRGPEKKIHGGVVLDISGRNKDGGKHITCAFGSIWKIQCVNFIRIVFEQCGDRFRGRTRIVYQILVI